MREFVALDGAEGCLELVPGMFTVFGVSPTVLRAGVRTPNTLRFRPDFEKLSPNGVSA